MTVVSGGSLNDFIATVGFMALFMSNVCSFSRVLVLLQTFVFIASYLSLHTRQPKHSVCIYHRLKSFFLIDGFDVNSFSIEF